MMIIMVIIIIEIISLLPLLLTITATMIISKNYISYAAMFKSIMIIIIIVSNIIVICFEVLYIQISIK